MSHDAYMVIDTGGPDGPAIVLDIGNYTRNVSPMWRAAMTAAAEQLGHDWRGESRSDAQMYIDDTQGMTGADALPLFRAAEAWMEDHATEMRELEPSNGWGDFEGALEYVAKCRRACVAHPKATLDWSV